MKVLFVANRIPYPPYRGDKLKIYNLAKELSKNNELHLITFVANKEELKYKEELEKIFETVQLVKQYKWRSMLNCILGIFSQVPFQVLYFKNKLFGKQLKKILNNNTFDAIHVQHLRMSQYFKQLDTSSKVVLDLPDAFSLYWQRRKEKASGFFQKLFINTEHSRLLKYEKRMFNFDLNLACSKEDIEYLRTKHGIDKIELLSNGVDVNTFKPLSKSLIIPRRVLFTGNMDYAPNIDGAAYFVEEILPIVESKVPDVEFVIAGQRPVKKVQDLAKNNIKITGFIPKLNEMYATAEVVVSPLRIGAGTQNKVLESMAMGIPVVCTNIGFEGLGAKNGEGIYSETDPKEFANRVIEILQDSVLRDELGVKATNLISNKFSWGQIASQLKGYLSHK